MTAKTLLLVFAATLVQVKLGLSEEVFYPSQADLRDWPCPKATAISPCVCTKIANELFLDCSKVTSDKQLADVFKQDFPFNNFTELKIIAKPSERRIPITKLPQDIFQSITFARIHISRTEIDFVYPYVFDKSLPFLEELIVTENYIRVFPFDLVDKAPLLKDLRVFRNHIIHMPEMTSTNLTYLHIGYNPGIEIGSHVFQFLPNLETLVANDIALMHVAREAFKNNIKLKYLDLSYNKLETLYEKSLEFNSNIETINLRNNRIHTVELHAISGLGRGASTILDMRNNLLEDLAQNVWEPVFNSVKGKIRKFMFDNNPIVCQCNILWLVRDPEHKKTLSSGVYCKETNDDLLNIDVPFLISSCP